MDLAVKSLKLIPANSLAQGTFFIPAATGALEVWVMVDGGRQVNGKFGVPLSGPQAFQARRLDRGEMVSCIPLPQGELIVRMGGSIVAPTYDLGALAIDEDGAAFCVEWSIGGMQKNLAFVDLASWNMQEDLNRQQSCVWLRDWELAVAENGNMIRVLGQGIPSRNASA